jgi:uncharacterized metal-binding protein
MCVYIYRERESYAPVSREVQNAFVLHVVFFIPEFKTSIEPFKVFSILKYVWRPNFTFFEIFFLLFLGVKNTLSL